jgi:hypothetical protein
MTNLLDSLAVGRKEEKDAKELLGAYLSTEAALMFNHTPQSAPSAPAAAPAGPAGPGGTGGGNRAMAQAVVANMSGGPLVQTPEYEVFRNEKNALGFFMYRQGALDHLSNEGPFWFQIDGDRIMAGTEHHQTVFENLTPELVDIARRRGVIMLVEFENQEAVRCTPCYLTDTI